MDETFLRIGIYLLGFFSGILGKFGADWLTDKRRAKNSKIKQNKTFKTLRVRMKPLFEEMRNDLETGHEWETIRSSDIRIFYVLTSEHESFVTPESHFVFYKNKYPNLTNWLHTLESEGYIQNLPNPNYKNPVNETKKYRMTEDFVFLLRKK